MRLTHIVSIFYSIFTIVACQIASHAGDNVWGKPDYEIPKPSEYDDSTDNEPKHIVFATYEDEPAEKIALKTIPYCLCIVYVLLSRRIPILNAAHSTL